MPNDPSTATLAFLSNPAPGVVLINLKIEGEDIRARLTRDQLFNLNKQTADALQREFK